MAEMLCGKHDIEGQIDNLFSRWNRNDAPGLVVGVVEHGELLYRRGFGMASLESAVANTPKTRMRIGSISKHFTSLLALLLAEDGKLDIDRPIRTYIPELVGSAGDPTLRLLMQHRGGSRCHIDLGWIGHGMASQPVGAGLQVLSRQQGRNFTPGEAMIYNNGGYYLISIAIERVGGAAFETQLHERLFAPLGMADTELIRTDYEINPGMATLHMPLPNGRWRRGLWPSDEFLGEGGIVSTVDDMLRWMAHLRTRNHFGTKESWDALFAPPELPDHRRGVYSLGLRLNPYRGLRTIYHAGGVMGGSSHMLTLPDDGLDIIIIANGAPGARPGELAERVVDILLAGQDIDPPTSISAQDYRAAIGDWWSSETGMIYRLVDDDGDLALSVSRHPMIFPLERDECSRLVSPGTSLSEIELDLENAAEGTITITSNGLSSIYHRATRTNRDLDAFLLAAGEYYSSDADTKATIVLEDGQLMIYFTDGHGDVAATLHTLSEVLAFTSPVSSTVPLHACIKLISDNSGVSGLQINTMRTRNLEFKRIQ